MQSLPIQMVGKKDGCPNLCFQERKIWWNCHCRVGEGLPRLGASRILLFSFLTSDGQFLLRQAPCGILSTIGLRPGLAWSH